MFSNISPRKKNRSLPTVLLYALTCVFTGGCPPPPSRSLCQRVICKSKLLSSFINLSSARGNKNLCRYEPCIPWVIQQTNK